MDLRTSTHSHDQTMGRLGEDLADAHLRRLGWQIIERNWRCSVGEIDIIALEPRGSGAPELVFVEVKYRSGRGYGDPLEAVTNAKVSKLRELSALWMQARRSGRSAPRVSGLRIDAIGVLRLPGGSHSITHVRGITR